LSEEIYERDLKIKELKEKLNEFEYNKSDIHELKYIETLTAEIEQEKSIIKNL